LQASIGRANESEAGIRAVMDSVADAILTFDEGGRIDSCNLAAERLFGYATAEVVGELIGRLVPEAALHASVTDWFATVRSGQSAASVGHECAGFRRDGTRVPLELATSETLVDGQRRLIVVARDTTERKQAEQVLRHQALHDELTGLPNRTLLQDQLRQAILAAGRESRPVTLLLVDLDRFKEINNTFGHHSGDLLLRQIGPRLRGVLHASDTVARLGGDEFGILLPGTNAADAVAVAQQLLRKLEAPFELDGQSFEIGASIGIAGYPAHGSDAAALLRQADVAMYVAKQGESGVVVYTTEQDHYSAERLALGGELRRALEGHELLLHYQPKLDLRDGTLAGVEALVRWQHPTRGLLLPAEFIPLAEETGLIVPLGRAVLHEACRQASEWHAGDPSARLLMSVNLAARQVREPGIVHDVKEALADTGWAAEFLQLELTESALMETHPDSITALRALADMGVRIAIDDFGTGYSNLAYLRHLPLHTLKLAGSFLSSGQHNRSDVDVDIDVDIVGALVHLAHILGLSVTVEAVETPSQAHHLRELGCDTAQGWHFAPALPPQLIPAFLRTPPWNQPTR
jgi:diguanylate cyclase (GGDEF)-like protein/PAS domain S-box-containing protein